MKMSAQQQLFLFRLLQDSISKDSFRIRTNLSIPYKERVAMLNTIINQQDDKLVEGCN